VEFLSALRRGIWRELTTPGMPIDTFRRNTQRVHLDTLDNRLNGTVEPSDEVRALIKGELRAARATIVAAIPATSDPATRRHLEDSRDQIDATLNPNAQRLRPGGAGRGIPPGAGASGPGHFDYDNDPFLRVSELCWEDRTVK
jgi:hypothetical protein